MPMGEFLGRFYPDIENPVIDIDIDAVQQAIGTLNIAPDATPATIRLEIAPYIDPFTESGIRGTMGFARPNKDGEADSEIKIGLGELTQEGMGIYSDKDRQVTVVHELQHAVDFASPSIMNKHGKFKEAYKELKLHAPYDPRRLMLTGIIKFVNTVDKIVKDAKTPDNPYTYQEIQLYKQAQDVYYKSPLEKRARKASKIAKKIPQIIGVSNQLSDEQNTNIE